MILSPTKPTSLSKSARLLLTPCKKQLQKQHPPPSAIAEPLFSQGSDEDSPTGLSSQIENLSLSESNESEGSLSGLKKGKGKGKGGAKDVWKSFEKREGEKKRRGRGKGERGKERIWSVFASFACECQKFGNSTVNAYILSSVQLKRRIKTIMLPVWEVEVGSQTSENT